MQYAIRKQCAMPRTRKQKMHTSNLLKSFNNIVQFFIQLKEPGFNPGSLFF